MFEPGVAETETDQDKELSFLPQIITRLLFERTQLAFTHP